MERANNWFIIKVTILFLVGVILYITKLHEFSVVPYIASILQLSIIGYLLAITYKRSNISDTFYFIFGLLALGMFILETVGVYTGHIFGEYQYGNGLAMQLFSVPIVIGLNWVVLQIGAMQIVERHLKLCTDFSKAISTGFLMVIFDSIMEPVAIQLDFWTWTGNTVPLQNYLVWFLYSFIAYYLLKDKLPLGKEWGSYFVIQIVYFLVLYLIKVIFLI